jgi:hypothetical protein
VNAAASLLRWALAAGCIVACGLAGAQEQHRPLDLGSFDRIEVSGMASIELSQGDRDVVTVTGDSDAVRGVQLEVTRGELRVNSRDSWKFWNRSAVLLQVQVRDLRHIGISGASEVRAARPMRCDQLGVSISGEGSVRLDDVQATQLAFDISGAGDASVGGRADDFKLSIAGKGKVNAERLKATRASVSVSGVGSADVWATDQLRISISGVGTVNYWGQPAVQRSSSGVARITALGDKR